MARFWENLWQQQDSDQELTSRRTWLFCHILINQIDWLLNNEYYFWFRCWKNRILRIDHNNLFNQNNFFHNNYWYQKKDTWSIFSSSSFLLLPSIMVSVTVSLINTYSLAAVSCYFAIYCTTSSTIAWYVSLRCGDIKTSSWVKGEDKILVDKTLFLVQKKDNRSIRFRRSLSDWTVGISENRYMSWRKGSLNYFLINRLRVTAVVVQYP